jgi:catalase (peroxidase I)
MKTTLALLTALLLTQLADAAEQSIKPSETIGADLLIVGADESGCAAAVQAARLGEKYLQDFVAAWTKVMELDRFDLAKK